MLRRFFFFFFSNFSRQDLKKLFVQTNNPTTRPKTEESDFPRRLGSWSCSHTGEKVLEMCLILEVLEKVFARVAAALQST